MKFRCVFLVALATALYAPCRADLLPAGKIVFASGAIIVDGSDNDPGWSQAPRLEYSEVVFGESSGESDLGLKVKLARDNNSLYGYLQVTDDHDVLPTWDNWRQGDFVVLCWSPTGRHGLPFSVSDRIIIARRDGVKLRKPLTDEWLTVEKAVINTATGGWTCEFSALLTAMGLPETGSAALAICQADIDGGFFKAVGSSGHGIMVLDNPAVWRLIAVQSQPEPLKVSGGEFKSTPDGAEVIVRLGWLVTYADQEGFAMQDPIRRGWVQVVAVCPKPSRGDVVFSLCGRFVTNADGIRRFLADSVDFESTDIKLPAITTTSRSLIPMQNGLLVCMTGRAQDVLSGVGFIVDDGGTRTQVEYSGSVPIVESAMVSVAGVVTYQGVIPTINATEIISR